MEKLMNSFVRNIFYIINGRINRKGDRDTYRLTDGQTIIHTVRHADRHTFKVRQTHIQIDKFRHSRSQADRQKYRQTHIGSTERQIDSQTQVRVRQTYN